MLQTSGHILLLRFWGFDSSPPSLPHQRIKSLSLRIEHPFSNQFKLSTENRERIEGTYNEKMAELPKEETFGALGLFIYSLLQLLGIQEGETVANKDIPMEKLIPLFALGRGAGQLVLCTGG